LDGAVDPVELDGAVDPVELDGAVDPVELDGAVDPAEPEGTVDPEFVAVVLVEPVPFAVGTAVEVDPPTGVALIVGSTTAPLPPQPQAIISVTARTAIERLLRAFNFMALSQLRLVPTIGVLHGTSRLGTATQATPDVPVRQTARSPSARQDRQVVGSTLGP
jgi:hypothetical protein